MKFIVAIVQSQDSNRLRKAFVKQHIPATQLRSTGGFLREGNTTFLVGVEDEKVQSVLDVIKDNAKSREQYLSSSNMNIEGGSSYPVNIKIGGAAIFVLPVDSFYHF